MSRSRRTWDVMFCQHLGQQEQRIVQEPLHLRQHLQKNSIPIVICAIAAKQVSGLDEVGVVAGIVAGICSGYDCCNGMCICNYDGGKCTGKKKEWKISSEKSLKKVEKTC